METGIFPLKIVLPVQLMALGVFIVCRKSLVQGIEDKIFRKIFRLYLFWTAICIVRGIFIAENYMEWLQVTIGSICLLAPIMIRIGYRPDIVSYVYRFWFKYWLLIFVVFFLINSDISPLYLFSPLFLLLCFFSLFRYKKVFYIILLAFIWIFMSGWGARSVIIKIIVSFLVGCVFYKPNFLSFKMIKFAHVGAYLLSFFFFCTILINVYQILTNKILPTAEVIGDESLTADSRSLIYVDVINSAIKNNYVLFGRTPARGNDIDVSGPLFYWAYDDMDNNSAFNKGERHINEILHANTFTWEGIVGLLLYTFIFFRASYLAVYKSKNYYIKILGCYIAFNWSFGFIENIGNIDALNFVLWTFVGMCCSRAFRTMDDEQFKSWAQTLL